MSAEGKRPSLRLACRLLLSRRGESLLDDRINIRRIRHVVLSDGVLILLRKKQEHSILEIMLRRSRRSRIIRLRGGSCGRRREVWTVGVSGTRR